MMDHFENSNHQSATDGLHYWAQLEGKSSTMTSDLLHRNEVAEKAHLKRHRITTTGGLAIYFALAVGVAALCLRCNGIATFGY